MLNKELLVEILQSKSVELTNFCVDNYIGKPGEVGCRIIGNEWYLYTIDDRLECIYTGPFRDDKIVYACALKLNVDELFEEYCFDDADYDVFSKHYYSVEEILRG